MAILKKEECHKFIYFLTSLYMLLKSTNEISSYSPYKKKGKTPIIKLYSLPTFVKNKYHEK